ncbi:N-acetylmuramidase [Xanthomonas sp. NCPPB 1128]|nr:glycosyl hydrolase 108 family protein [Xanthomonas sp. NCPPB 1128]KMM74174.1 N-acetylmuramidase [Xanthomonas sp. NCPPB 1128]
MADFNAFFPTLLKHEGGFVNDPVDPGGATNKGITLATFRIYAKSLLQLEPTLDNLRALTDAQAVVIYKTCYWNAVHGDEIALQPLANILFDFQVNAGNNAIKLLQRVLNAQTATLKLPEEGKLGPATLAALKAADQRDLYARYKQGRRDYYQRLVAARPPLAKFLKGWLARTDSFPDLS